MKLVRSIGGERLHLSVGELQDVAAGATLSGEGMIVMREEETVQRRFELRSTQCASCDRPGLCAIIKNGTAPCGLNQTEFPIPR